VLLPAEAVNDDLVFVDDVSADDLAGRAPMPVHLSYDFVDVLSELGSRNAEVGTDQLGSAFRVPRSAFEAGQGWRAPPPPWPSSAAPTSASPRCSIGSSGVGKRSWVLDPASPALATSGRRNGTDGGFW